MDGEGLPRDGELVLGGIGAINFILKLTMADAIYEELILPAVKKVLERVLHHSASYNVINKVPLSNDTVQRRIDEMAESVEVSLCEILVSTKFSLHVDESTLPGN